MQPPKPSDFVRRNFTAIGIFSFNRPECLRRVLESFRQNENLDAYDFYFFQDGAINPWSGRVATTQALVDACVAEWEKAELPHKQQFVRTANAGVAINQFEAKDLLFEGLGYERCMFFEDDLVLGPTYLRTLQLMLDQFEHEKQVGAVMCHGEIPRHFHPREQRWYLSHVVSAVNLGFDHLWGWGTWRDRWQRVKPHFLHYYQIVSACDYRFRNHKAIKAFYAKQNCAMTNTCQDFAYYFGMFKSGMVSVNTFIHRGKYIGESGEHMTPEIFRHNGYDSVALPNPDWDRKLKRLTGYDPKAYLAHSRFVHQLREGPPTAAELAAEAAYPKPQLIPAIQRYRKWGRRWQKLKKLVMRLPG